MRTSWTTTRLCSIVFRSMDMLHHKRSRGSGAFEASMKYGWPDKLPCMANCFSEREVNSTRPVPVKNSASSLAISLRSFDGMNKL